MNTFLTKSRIPALSALLALCGSAYAVGGAAVVDDTHTDFVGRVLTDLAGGSGALIKPNADYRPWVLTAAHCMNYESGDDRAKIFVRQHFERFADKDGKVYFGLGVQHSDFASLADNSEFGDAVKDIGFMLLLNGPEPASVGALAAENVSPAIGDVADIVGFSGLANTVFTAKKGKVKLKAAADVGENAIAWRLPDSVNFIQSGDSGGPTFDANDKIIGVHSFSTHSDTPYTDDNLTASVDIRANKYPGFLKGDEVGAGGGGKLNRYVGVAGATKQWEDDNAWKRGTANENSAPNTKDIAVIDPTKNSDKANYTIEIKNNSTNELEGLLSDVTIKVFNGKALNIAGKTGALNGGVMEFGGTTAGSLNVNHSIENVGAVTIKDKGTASIGAQVPDLDAVLPDSKKVSHVLWNSPGATFTVEGGGTLNTAMAGVLKARTRITNDSKPDGTSKAVFRVEGADGKPAKADGDFFNNSGDLTVKTNAKLTLGANTRRFYVGGNPADILTNSNKGVITVGNGGEIVLDNTGLIEPTDPNSQVLGTAKIRNYGVGAADTKIVIQAGGKIKSNLITNTSGLVNVEADGTLDVSRTFMNGEIVEVPPAPGFQNPTYAMTKGVFEVSGKAALGSLDNTGRDNYPAAAASVVTVKKGGELNAAMTIKHTQDSDATISNGTKATLEVQAGGKLTAAGRVWSDGTLKIGASIAGIGSVTFKKGAAVPGDDGSPRRTFDNAARGVIEFDSANDKKPDLRLDDMEYTDKGVIKGAGNFTITRATSFKMEAKSADLAALDLRSVDVMFDAAKPGGGNDATFEAASLDKGAAGYANGAFLSRFALNAMCLKNNSEVRLLDAFEKNDPHADADPLREVLYVTNFGIEEGSIFDLGGGTLYFVNKLLGCGDPFAGGRYRNGIIKQIPTPGCIALGCLSLLIVARRRRS